MEPATPDPTAARLRGASYSIVKRTLALVGALIVLALVIGVSLAWISSKDQDRTIGRNVQAYYDGAAAGRVRVSECSSATDVERSIPLYVCRVSSHDRAVFGIRPAPRVEHEAAHLCFAAQGEVVQFFGIAQERKPDLCAAATGSRPFYRG